MSAISTDVNKIRNAVWADEVRESIAHGIEQCYSDVSNPTLQTDALEAALQAKIDEGEMAALTIGDGTITTAKIANGAITQAKLDPNISFEADDELDATSTNAIQNKVVAAAISEVNESLGNKVGVSDRNIVTYDMLHKSVPSPISGTSVDFWYTNKTLRTDGTSLEYTIEADKMYTWEVPSGVAQKVPTFVQDSDSSVHTDDSAFCVILTNSTYLVTARYAGKMYLTTYWNTDQYSTGFTIVEQKAVPDATDFLHTGWKPDIMDITAYEPIRVTHAVKWYSSSGSLQTFNKNTIMYYIPRTGWYKCSNYIVLLDSSWNFVEYRTNPVFYNDGSYAYVQGTGWDTDVTPVYMGEGITAFDGMSVVSRNDGLDLNKPFAHALVCFGDSITSTGYPGKLASLANCVAINNGASGASSGVIRKLLTNIGSENHTGFDWTANPVDTVIIMAGYNDTYQGTIADDIPSTDITDAGNDWTAYLALFNASHSDAGTTCGNLGFMIEWLQANHSNVRILLCNYHNNNDSKPTRAADVDAAVQAVSEYYGIQMIDIRRTCGINKKNTDTYTTDGLHPNAAGQGLIAKAILRGM